MDGLQGLSDDDLMAMAEQAIEASPDVDGQADAQTVADDAGADDTAEPPAEQDQQQAAEQTEQQQAKDWNPDGPGDKTAALRQAREEIKAEKAARQALEQEANELRQWRQQQDNERRQAQYLQDERARLEQRNAMLEDVFDPESRAQLLERFAHEDRYIANQQASQALVQARYEDGFALGREAYSDFDAVLNKATADPEQASLLEAVAAKALQQGKNPVIAAYQMAKRMDPDAQQALIQAEVKKQVQAVLQKQQPPANRGHATIGHATSQVPGAAVTKDVRSMSTEDLQRAAGLI